MPLVKKAGLPFSTAGCLAPDLLVFAVWQCQCVPLRKGRK
jgi:hypothetical protein